MEEITFKNWADFDKIVKHKLYRKWIFRGHSEFDWELESSLERTFNEAEKIHQLNDGKKKDINRREHEKVMIDRFKCHAHLYLNHLPDAKDDLSWLSIMQHHGAPTRLLDFTFSAYIALYFALEKGSGDAAIYCINHHALKKDDNEYFGENCPEVHSRILDGEEHNDKICLFSFEPKFSNQRLLSQQGLFVATNTLDDSHEHVLSQYTINEDDSLKIRIPVNLRYSGLKKLDQVNLNAAIIYPGLDGFCKSMKRQPVFGLKWQRRVGK